MVHDLGVGHDESGVAAPTDSETTSAAAPVRPTLDRLRAQRRRNRLLFFAGLVAIVVPGVWWAATTQDPIRGGDNRGGDFFGPVGADFGFEEEIFFEEEFFGEVPVTTFAPFEG